MSTFVCLCLVNWFWSSSCFLITVLNQLPLPSPLPATTTKSLLFNGRIAEEVNCLLACRDENLVSQLVHSLNQVSTDHMYVFWTSTSDYHPYSLKSKLTGLRRMFVKVWKLEHARFSLGLLSRWLQCKSQVFQSDNVINCSATLTHNCGGYFIDLMLIPFLIIKSADIVVLIVQY